MCYCDDHYDNNKSFIEKSKKIHGDKYDYSLVNYIDQKIKIIIICSKHGEFKQQPKHHLEGSGCPLCNDSKGERIILNYLKSNNLKYQYQKTFNNCKYIQKLRFDFYLSDYNICIEYDGMQHFKSINFFGGDNELIKQKEKDKIKTNFCLENKIILIRIRYDQDIESILKEKIPI